MPTVDRETAVRELVAWHFRVEPELQRVFVLRSVGDTPDAPVRLLEVNAATAATGSIEAFGFAPTEEVPFRTVIAEITPEELESLRHDPSALKRSPEWDLEGAEDISRPQGD